jgi:hypothetical protein
LNGDILPNQQYSYVPPKKKRNREKDEEEDEEEEEGDDSVDVGNITSKVLGAIAALLDNFFESKTIPFTNPNRQVLVKYGNAFPYIMGVEANFKWRNRLECAHI